ncbi:MAG: hypothetical protein ABGZ35_03720 [Planctomycetaceae bacterium]
MNAVGKMLVVLQLCLSLLFVCFAGATYSLQDTWKKKAESADAKAASLLQNQAQVTAEQDLKVSAAERLMHDALTAQATAAVKLNSAQQHAETTDGLLAEVRQARDKAIAENERSAAESDARLAETIAHRKEIEALHVRLAAQLADVREKDSEILDLTNLTNNYRLSEERHVASQVRMTAVLRANNIDPSARVNGSVPELVEKVDGYVVAKLQSRSRTQEFAKITLGSDDKIEEGMTVYVFRQDKFVCDMRIADVDPDSSVGIVVPGSRRYSIEEGDRVTTRL